MQDINGVIALKCLPVIIQVYQITEESVLYNIGIPITLIRNQLSMIILIRNQQEIFLCNLHTVQVMMSNGYNGVW